MEITDISRCDFQARTISDRSGNTEFCMREITAIEAELRAGNPDEHGQLEQSRTDTWCAGCDRHPRNERAGARGAGTDRHQGTTMKSHVYNGLGSSEEIRTAVEGVAPKRCERRFRPRACTDVSKGNGILGFRKCARTSANYDRIECVGT